MSRARELESQGKTEEALDLYRQWLDEAAGKDELLSVAFHATGLESSLPDKIELLAAVLEKAREPGDKHDLLVALAELQEITGDLLSAQKGYVNASFVVPGNKDFESLLSSARLLVEMGEYRDAEAQARGMVETAKDTKVTGAALVILSRIYAATEREQKAVETAIRSMEDPQNPPSVEMLYWAVELGRRVDNVPLESTALAVLETEYEGSLELALVSGDITAVPAVANLFSFGLDASSGDNTTRPGIDLEAVDETDVETENIDETPGPAFLDIQTGSFLVKENAEYALQDLETEGFQAIVRERLIGEKLYYRVVVPDVPAETVQNVLVQLKERGFEGYPLYE